MPCLVQFDRPQRCWFWLLYSCVHKCTCYFTRYAAWASLRKQLACGGWLASVLQDASYSFLESFCSSLVGSAVGSDPR